MVYIPQESAKAAELKRLYNRKGVEKATMEQARVILMGDFNAKIGDGGEDEASKGGEMLMEMARKQDLYIVNTDERCRGKWTRILGEEKSVLDYMLIKKEDRSYIRSMEIDEKCLLKPTKYGKDKVTTTDHNSIVLKLIVEKISKPIKSTFLNTKSEENRD